MPHSEILSQLFEQYFHQMPTHVVQLQQSGSDRIYFRLNNTLHSCIGCYGKDIHENETFIHHAVHFKNKGVSVPEVYLKSEDSLYYVQEDLGDVSLYSLLKKNGVNQDNYSHLKRVIEHLAFLQIKGAEDFDFSTCYPIQQFNRSSMFWDLNSFKYYFVRMARVHFNEPLLNKDFHALCDYLLEEPNQYFMFRDCQSRNIIIHNNQPYFIDFQGGRKGALQYDIASLLWQAGAKIPMDIRTNLFDNYVSAIQQYITIDEQDFRDRYKGFILIRILQVLGAYGFRGLIEQKAHFIESILPALENLKLFVGNIPHLPELNKVIEQLIQADIFQPKNFNSKTDAKLVVTINSFSFKRGIPTDDSGNGGGFVFDCRGIHNPGRYEPYKLLNGKDAPVIEFLETKTIIKDFLNHVYNLIDINISDYVERNFEHLQINFGCTGGQHRSVYCAEQTAKYIKEKYNIKVDIRHIERELQGEFI